MITYPKLQKYAVIRVGWSTTLPISIGMPIFEVGGASELKSQKEYISGLSDST